MYLRMKHLKALQRGKAKPKAHEPRPQPSSVTPKVKPKLGRIANTGAARKIQDGLLAIITERQEARWKDVLDEYRAEQNLTRNT